MIRRPPRSTLFPYTTLFRSRPLDVRDDRVGLVPCLDQQPGADVGFRVGERLLHHPRDVGWWRSRSPTRSEEHTSELQSRPHLVCRLLLEKKNKTEHVHKQSI